MNVPVSDAELQAYLSAAMRFCAEHGPVRPGLLSRAAGYQHLPACDQDECPDGCTSLRGMLVWIRAFDEGYLIHDGWDDQGRATYRIRGEEPFVEMGQAYLTPETATQLEIDEQQDRLLKARQDRLLKAIFGESEIDDTS